VVNSSRLIAGCAGGGTSDGPHLLVAQVATPRVHANGLGWEGETVKAVREVVVIDPVDLQAIRETAERVGVETAEVPPFRGIRPVKASVLVVGERAAVGQVRAEVERRRGGLVFDLRVGAVRPIHRSRALGHGELEVVAADGLVRVGECDPELVAALTRLASGRGEKTVACVRDLVDAVS
jgi:hypothetical protein